MYFIYNSKFLNHLTGIGHPECPERLETIISSINNKWPDKLEKPDFEIADTNIIKLVHPAEYIKIAEYDCKSGYNYLSTGDTNICRDSYSIALLAVGGILKAVDMVIENGRTAFCAVRPPGHHATIDAGMGFCIFNNIAIAAKYAQEKYGLEKVLIADWDVHHGNGTQDIFYNDNSVLFWSTHQFPLYPGTGNISEIGSGKGEGFTFNRPFPAGTGDKEIIDVFKNQLLPVARNFKPDLTLISAGFDSRINDPLGGFQITDNGFRELTKIMLEISYLNGNGRLISILEGGYNLSGLASAVTAHIDELIKK